MKKYRWILALFLLAACAAPQMTPQQMTFLHELADRPVTCQGTDDCDAKWNRAIQWVSEHSAEGISTITDRLISTNMVRGGGRNPLHYPEFTVVRYTAGRHGYRMDFSSYCEHGFECNPSALQLRVGFVTFVMGLPEGVSEPSPGVFRKTIHTHTDD